MHRKAKLGYAHDVNENDIMLRLHLYGIGFGVEKRERQCSSIFQIDLPIERFDESR